MMKNVSSIEKYNLFLGMGGIILGILVILLALIWPINLGIDPMFPIIVLTRFFIGMLGVGIMIYSAVATDETIQSILKTQNDR